MIPGSFDYHAPDSLAEAIQLLGRYGADAKVLSGGQSLLPLLKLRLGSAGHLVDIGRIPDLEYIREDGGFLKIGGRTRESALEESALIRTKYPILFETAAVIADPIGAQPGDRRRQPRARRSRQRPSGDDARAGRRGRRDRARRASARSRSSEFFTGLFETALGHDEILTEIRIPVPPAGSGGAYLKLERKVGDFATAAVAVHDHARRATARSPAPASA